MAGSILGQDQIEKINATYPAIVAHIRALFAGDKTPAGLMRIHFLTEHLDTTELSAIFTGMPYLAPAEKRALVRAAIFEVLLTPEAVVTSYVPSVRATDTPAKILKSFTPSTQFKLNAATSEASRETKGK